ncbi:GNAT family N-acetyltransferase [Sphingomonas naphthae]|uniref:GNAT family N-acetyltransferase n=1 Tax=Sphingomonas naphthae TaxID=1813468 RepID=A0ABY7TI24_9SPHN|nr:GNAT family N-acetyltransferase [Sphingomonas naphthae]WCT72446.1 GNAT family N-acetyltransferase [Sphingomonas naphthae]
MFARTQRLFLRPGWLEDAEPLARAIGDRAVAETLARVPHPYTMDDARAYLAAPEDAWPRLLIFLMDGGEAKLAGGIGLDEDDRGINLGYWIARPYWGQGIATEAGRAMLEIADTSLGLDRIVAGHFHGNETSGNVLRKLGFRPTGTSSRRYNVVRGAILPCVDFVRDRQPAALAA